MPDIAEDVEEKRNIGQKTLNGIKIKIIGIGKIGNNVINKMVTRQDIKADFIAIDTEQSNLTNSKARTKIFVSSMISYEAVEELKKQIKKELQDADMTFIMAEMGEKTGTPASAIIAKIARSMKVLTVAVVSKPFKFEATNKIKLAKKGKKKLKHLADTVITIPYQRLNDLYKNTTMENIYEKGEKSFITVVKGILDLIKKQGIVNLDFADIKLVLRNSGKTVLGFGKANGENRAKKAVEQALNTPLLEYSIKGAGKILMNITSGNDIRLEEISQIATTVAKNSENPNLSLVWGTVFEENKLENQESLEKNGSFIKVYLIATDFCD